MSPISEAVPSGKARNKSIKGKILAIILAPLLVAGGLAGSFAISQDASASTAAVGTIHAGTNGVRAQLGLQALELNGAMSANAQAWAEHMAATDDYQHNPNFAGGSPAGSTSWAENIAAGVGAGFANEAVSAWVGSSGHYANMTKEDFTQIGVGFAVSETTGRAYAVQQFASYNYIPPSPPTAPTAPTVASNGDGTATVSWEYTNTGSQPINYTELRQNGEIFNVGAGNSAVVNVLPGTSYTFDVQTYNNVGASGWSAASNHDEPFTEPRNLSINIDTISTNLATASLSVGSTGGHSNITYIVSIDNSYKYLSESNTISISDLVRNTTYSGEAVASNASGTSEPVRFSFVTPMEKPTSPLNYQPVFSNGTLTNLSWDAPADNGGDSNLSYAVNITDDTTGETVLSTSTTLTSLDAIEGIKGHDYTATVTASNQMWTSEPATAYINVPQTVTSAPPAPTAVQVDESSILVAWDDPADIGGSDIVGYSVKAYVNDKLSATMQLDYWGNTLVYTGRYGINVGDSYRFTVSAINGIGESTESELSEAVIHAELNEETPTEPEDIAPSSVTNLRVENWDSGFGSGLQAFWDSPENAGSSDIIAYQVDILNSEGETVVTASTAEYERFSRINNLKPGETYTVRVVAVNLSGAGEVSEVEHRTQISGPDAPTGINAEKTVVDGRSALKVTWEAPLSNGGQDIRNYIVSVIDDNDQSYYHTIMVSSVEPVIFTNLKPGNAYTVIVQADNGFRPSFPARASFSTGTDAPAAPNGVNINVNDDKSVLVTWDTPNDGTPNNSVGIKSYAVGLYDNEHNLIEQPTGFNMFRSVVEIFSNTEPSTVEIVGNEIAFSGLASGDYFVSITATNNDEVVGETSEASFTILEDEYEVPGDGDSEEPGDGDSEEPEISKPSVPSKFSAQQVGFSGVTLTWETPKDKGNAEIDEYILTKTVDGNSVSRSLSSDTTSATFMSLISGAEYVFELKAVNAAGEGAAATVKYSQPNLLPPLDSSGEKPVDIVAAAPGGEMKNLGSFTWAPVNFVRDLFGTTRSNATPLKLEKVPSSNVTEGGARNSDVKISKSSPYEKVENGGSDINPSSDEAVTAETEDGASLTSGLVTGLITGLIIVVVAGAVTMIVRSKRKSV